MKYTIEQIRAAGKRGELCSIDTEYLIKILKEKEDDKPRRKETAKRPKFTKSRNEFTNLLPTLRVRKKRD